MNFCLCHCPNGVTSSFCWNRWRATACFNTFRPLYQGHLIANVDMTQERANRLIEAGLADSIAFGRPYIANPDLPERFLTGAKLNEVSWPTVYASGSKGYTDYPTLITAG